MPTEKDAPVAQGQSSGLQNRVLQVRVLARRTLPYRKEEKMFDGPT